MGLYSWLESWLACTRDKRLTAQAARLHTSAPIGPVTAPQVQPPRWRPHVQDGVAFQRSPNFLNMGAQARKVDLVVLHCTAGSFRSAVEWLCHGDRPNPTSAHYVVRKDGYIVQLVAEKDVAWHAGYGSWNGRGSINIRSIGIELENAGDEKDTYPDAQVAATLWLAERACIRHGLSPEAIVRHSDVDPVRRPYDPGQMFPIDDFRYALAVTLKSAPGDIAS